MRGTPIPSDFELSKGMRDWAEKNTPAVNVEKEHEKFVDYWLANGKCMFDWTATWRNWMRRSPQMGGCLYTADELRLKRLKAEYVAAGFRAPLPHENSVMYDFDYGVWKRHKEREQLPKRDMSVVTSLAKAKTA